MVNVPREEAKTFVKRLRPCLKKIMGIQADPFYLYSEVKAYRTKFRLTSDLF